MGGRRRKTKRPQGYKKNRVTKITTEKKVNDILRLASSNEAAEKLIRDLFYGPNDVAVRNALREAIGTNRYPNRTKLILKFLE